MPIPTDTPARQPAGPRGRAPRDPEPGAAIPAFEVADDREHRVLERWRRNVGAAVALDLAPRAPAGARELDLLCWNVAVGAGELDAMLRRLREEGVGRDPARPLVVLAQEVYRSDETIPARPPEPRHTGGNIAPPRPRDVVELAREHGLSLRYAPSMRNGAARSDRGNAILCTAGLGRAHAFVLLHINQRRVVVAAEVEGIPGLTFVCAHLDVARRLGEADSPSYRPGAARAEQAGRLAEAVMALDAPGGVVLAGDFNTPFGEWDPAYRRIVRAGFRPAERSRRWDHTHHGFVRLLLDHVFYHPGGGRIASVRVERLDDHPLDRGARIFGSDHHPLLARVALAPG